MIALVKQTLAATIKPSIDNKAMTPPDASLPVTQCAHKTKPAGTTEIRLAISAFALVFFLTAIETPRGKMKAKAHAQPSMGLLFETIYLSTLSACFWLPSSTAPVHVESGSTKDTTSDIPNIIFSIRIDLFDCLTPATGARAVFARPSERSEQLIALVMLLYSCLHLKLKCLMFLFLTRENFLLPPCLCQPFAIEHQPLLEHAD